MPLIISLDYLSQRSTKPKCLLLLKDALEYRFLDWWGKIHWCWNFINLLHRNVGITKVVGKRYLRMIIFVIIHNSQGRRDKENVSHIIWWRWMKLVVGRSAVWFIYLCAIYWEILSDKKRSAIWLDNKYFPRETLIWRCWEGLASSVERRKL